MIEIKTFNSNSYQGIAYSLKAREFCYVVVVVAGNVATKLRMFHKWQLSEPVQLYAPRYYSAHLLFQL